MKKYITLGFCFGLTLHVIAQLPYQNPNLTNDATGLLKTLKGFEKITLAAGQKGTVTIHLPYSAFTWYDEAKQLIAVRPGTYEIGFGTSSADKDLRMIQIAVQ